MRVESVTQTACWRLPKSKATIIVSGVSSARQLSLFCDGAGVRRSSSPSVSPPSGRWLGFTGPNPTATEGDDPDPCYATLTLILEGCKFEWRTLSRYPPQRKPPWPGRGKEHASVSISGAVGVGQGGESGHVNCYRGPYRRVKNRVTERRPTSQPQEAPVSPRSVHEYLQVIRTRYAAAPRATKTQLLTEVCATTGYHRKAAIRVLRQPPSVRRHHHRRGRPSPYNAAVAAVLARLWEAAGYPWSVRLKALLPLWLPWAKQRMAISPAMERALRPVSPSTIDRVLRARKRRMRRRLYGRTKPGTLLKHHIPVKTAHWDVTDPGFTEVDLVSHSGDSADGEFLQSLNLTDIFSGWVETRAVMGKGQ